MIVGLLLAAGAARRFGAPKLLQPLRGTPVVRWSALALRDAVDELLVVLPPWDAGLRRALDGIGARFVINAEPGRGLGSSIVCGIDALSTETEAVVIALADEPLLDTRWIDAVVRHYRATRAAIVAAVFDGIRRHPVLFDRQVFPELLQLDSDRGARDVVERDPLRVELVQFPEPGTIDVDTREDLARLERGEQFSAPRKRPSP